MATFHREDVTQLRNELQTSFGITWDRNSSNSSFTCTSKTYKLCGLVSLQIQVDIRHTQKSSAFGCYILLCNKIQPDDHVNYTISVKRGEEYLDKVYLCDGNIQAFLRSWTKYTLDFEFDFILCLAINPRMENLYKDTELTDFQLTGEDGPVPVHRLVLAMYSPVMKTMLTGPWKEAKEGRVEIPTSVKTLTHLREYMYLDKLPDTFIELKPLLELAFCYQFTDLMQKCCIKLIFGIDAENKNIPEIIELALKYKLKSLLLGVLQQIALFINNNPDNTLFLDDTWDIKNCKMEEEKL